MKAFRALMLVLALCACAYADGNSGYMPNGRSGEMPCGRDGDMPFGKDGYMPNGKTAASDATADVILTLLQNVLPLL
jgi:hypothetical protein